MIRIQRTRLEILENPIPKYYGWGKSAHNLCIGYYYSIPFNFLVRFWERIKYRYFEVMQNDKIRIREQRIYMRGYSDALKLFDDRINDRVNDRLRGWANEKRR